MVDRSSIVMKLDGIVVFLKDKSAIANVRFFFKTNNHPLIEHKNISLTF